MMNRADQTWPEEMTYVVDDGNANCNDLSLGGTRARRVLEDCPACRGAVESNKGVQ